MDLVYCHYRKIGVGKMNQLNDATHEQMHTRYFPTIKS